VKKKIEITKRSLRIAPGKVTYHMTTVCAFSLSNNKRKEISRKIDKRKEDY